MASNIPPVGTMSSSDSDRESDERAHSDNVSEDGSPSKISSYNSGFRVSMDSDSDVGFLRTRSDSTSDDGSSHYSVMDSDDILKRSGSVSSSCYGPTKKKFRSSSGDQDDSEDIDSEGYKMTSPHSYGSTAKRMKSESKEVNAGSSRSLWRTEDDDSAPSYSNMYRPRKDAVFQDNKAAKIMAKMGFQAGMGLGKEGQGITEPVELSKQRGRRGLGLNVQGLEPANLEWRFDKEVVTVEEHVEWLENGCRDSIDPPFDWAVEGKKKLTIDDEDHFCSSRVVKDVMSSKSTFDELEGKELRKAVARSNPYETIRGGIFLNRAAMKMANMDKVFDFMFTKPKDAAGNLLVKSDQLLYFADVCAGPGGFSEYVLWRLKWKAKGFGFTLKSENDFKLSDFFAGPCESFEPHYGVKDDEDTGDGDVFNPRNQEVFKQFVLDNTDDHGVHFMMADGGFSVEGQENIQEILSKQLYLCQFLVALQIVRVDGHFVCKVFDLFTEFSVGLIYLLYRSFTKISIHKPNSSRPANSERYIICKWKRHDCGSISDYLFRVNRRLCSLSRESDRDIVRLVPLSVMEEDTNFMQYIYNSNVRLGELQIIALQKVIAFCKDTSLEEVKQAEMRKKCMEFWEVPDDARKAPNKLSADDSFSKILESGEKGCSIDPNIIFNSKERDLTLINLESTFAPIYNWYCAVLGNPKRGDSTLTFFLGTGRSSVFYLSGRKWLKAMNLELSAGTLLLGEMVKEIKGEKQRQVKTNALHIVDAVCLGGIDIRHYHIADRVKHCQLFAKAMNKPSRTDLAPIYSKELFELTDILNIQERMKNLIMKNSKQQKVFDLNRDGACIVPHGMIFFNGTQAPWNRHWSRTHRHLYYHNGKTNKSKFDYEKPQDACKSFGNSYNERAASWWDEHIINAISIEDIIEFVQKRLRT